MCFVLDLYATQVREGMIPIWHAWCTLRDEGVISRVPMSTSRWYLLAFESGMICRHLQGDWGGGMLRVGQCWVRALSNC
jgi:hypothetical protein